MAEMKQMETPGNILKAEREKLNLTVKDVAKRLRLNPDYLSAIEIDDYSTMPAEVFTKSYIRMYAAELGLDGDYIIGVYDKCSNSAPPKQEEPVIEEAGGKEIDSRPALLKRPGAVAAGAALILVVLFFLFRGEGPDHKAGVAPGESAVKESVESHGKVQQKLILKILAEEITWVSVRPDGGETSEWLLRKGQSAEIGAEDYFRIKVGNGGGTRLILNGEDLGVAGPRGKVVDLTLPYGYGQG